ncbi:unnamed protein product [Caenorhabditis auriculariae]|uniref:C3H1-type domain-containing protein n=1 Tax=Caenorhabditis auriculariae TaxID=2777116 RepID=A0A8S1GUN4_9PELO|nr:unnamed protein product [Caenorhabditis auriculariae]
MLSGNDGQSSQTRPLIRTSKVSKIMSLPLPGRFRGLTEAGRLELKVSAAPPPVITQIETTPTQITEYTQESYAEPMYGYKASMVTPTKPPVIEQIFYDEQQPQQQEYPTFTIPDHIAQLVKQRLQDSDHRFDEQTTQSSELPSSSSIMILKDFDVHGTAETEIVDPPTPPQTNSFRQIQEHCRYYLHRANGCDRAGSCRFIHDPNMLRQVRERFAMNYNINNNRGRPYNNERRNFYNRDQGDRRSRWAHNRYEDRNGDYQRRNEY